MSVYIEAGVGLQSFEAAVMVTTVELKILIGEEPPREWVAESCSFIFMGCCSLRLSRSTSSHEEITVFTTEIAR